MKYDALLFDLDGTLVDTLPDLRCALNGLLRGLGRRELSAGEVRQMIGDGTRALVERALATTGSGADLEAAHQQFLQIYEAAPTRLSRLYPGVEETLRSLRASGARLAICTNKPQSATLQILKDFQIADCFDVVLGGDVVAFRKPDPRHLLAALDRLGASEAVMIGDNENDYAAARAADVPVILMRYGYLRLPATSLNPEAWLDSFADLQPTLAHLPANAAKLPGARYQAQESD